VTASISLNLTSRKEKNPSDRLKKESFDPRDFFFKVKILNTSESLILHFYFYVMSQHAARTPSPMAPRNDPSPSTSNLLSRLQVLEERASSLRKQGVLAGAPGETKNAHTYGNKHGQQDIQTRLRELEGKLEGILTVPVSTGGSNALGSRSVRDTIRIFNELQSSSLISASSSSTSGPVTASIVDSAPDIHRLLDELHEIEEMDKKTADAPKVMAKLGRRDLNDRIKRVEAGAAALEGRVRNLRRRCDRFLAGYEEVVQGINEEFVGFEERMGRLEC